MNDTDPVSANPHHGNDSVYEDHSEKPNDQLKKSAESDISWRGYPFNLTTFNPLTEWGEHYGKIFERDLWRQQSCFDLLDVKDGVVSTSSLADGFCSPALTLKVDERHIVGSRGLETVLKVTIQ